MVIRDFTTIFESVYRLLQISEINFYTLSKSLVFMNRSNLIFLVASIMLQMLRNKFMLTFKQGLLHNVFDCGKFVNVL